MTRSSGIVPLGLLSALLCAASCTILTPDPIPERRTITLAPTGERSRAVVPEDRLSPDYDILLSAYMSSGTDARRDGDYFVGRPFRNTGDLWESDPVSYWPLGCSLDFLALAYDPADPDGADIPGAAVWYRGNCTLGVEVTVKGRHCLGSEVLYAAATRLDVGDDGGRVPLCFRHSQSWLRFQFSSTQDDMFRVDSIVVAKAYNGGTLRIGNGIYLLPAWDFHGFRREDTAVPGAKEFAVGTGTCGYDLLLPEQDACDILVHYRQKTVGTEEWADAEARVFRLKASPDPWLYGQRTVYDFRFTPREVTFRVTVAGWDDNTLDIVMQ